jgi:hypothetical protein
MIKQLHDKSGNGENVRIFNDFRNECETQFALDHPNIIQLYGMKEEEGWEGR